MKMLGSIICIYLLIQTQVCFANGYFSENQQMVSHYQKTSPYLLVDFHWHNGLP